MGLPLCDFMYHSVCVQNLCRDSESSVSGFTYPESGVPPPESQGTPPCLAGELDSVDQKCISHVVHTETIPKRYGEPLLRLMQWLKIDKTYPRGYPRGYHARN
jgi:hypothetical protein